MGEPAVARTVGGGRSDTPTIPEAELIAVLSDIVKRDADPNVRSEALQGIYRLRTDASIDAPTPGRNSYLNRSVPGRS